MTENEHLPVLPTEVIEFLDAGRDGTYVDCTLGLAGHALALLETNPRARLIGLDRDGESLEIARERLKPYAKRVTLYQADFKDLAELDIPFEKVRGILADLGISSFQLDSPERGFSYMHEGPLDMRMDRRLKTDGRQDPPHLPGTEAGRDVREVRRARPDPAAGPGDRPPAQARPARNDRRPQAPHRADLPVAAPEGPHPSRGQGLPGAPHRDQPGARRARRLHRRDGPSAPRRARGFVIISFHSLEDRIVKQAFHALARPEDGAPLLALLTKKPVMASDAEVAVNSRARSAKLRAAERI